MKGLFRKILFAVLAGMGLYVAYGLYTGYEQIAESLASFRWSSFGLALLLATLNYGLRFLKWEYYLARLEIRHVPKLESLLVFLSGFVLTVTPGKIGEVFKSAVLAETHGVPLERTAPIVVAERLTDVIGVVALIALGSLGFEGGLAWAAAGSALVAVALIFALWPPPGDLALRLLEGGPAFGRRLVPKLRTSLAALRVVASPTALVFPSLVSVVAWGAEGLALYVLLVGFGASASLPLATFFYSTSTLAGAIVPVPGGLGVTEGMLREQLARLGGVSGGVATASMILVRFATLWWAVIVGFFALAWLKARHPGLLAGASESPA